MLSLGKGKKSWILARIYPVKDIAGNIDKIILIHEDITKQKNIEQELIRAKEKAEESDRLKSAFLANMSHEIRTPMNGILGFINLLNQPNLSKEKIDTYSKVINKSGNRLLDTINDIIDFSKVESGEMDTTISKIYLNNELDELYSFHATEANSKGLSLLIEPSLLTKEVTVFTDGHKLHGILTNLIKNALKYTEKGSITFGYSLKNNFIEFFVKDTGIGIPKNRLHAIFNRFEQVDIEDKRVFQGSGLGLAISKAYTEMLGGEIFVESEQGKGSIFKFTIPFNKLKNKSIKKTVVTVDNSISKFGELNLLIVDDDVISSNLLEIMLEGIFKKVIFAKNGVEAIKLCKNNTKIDIVLMDIKMPEMDGYNATSEIRKITKDLIIIAQTAYVLSGDKEKMLKVGCNDYISKPINKELLLEIINKNISKKCTKHNP
jgi:signal transduction histidine kinase/CheY-like chemotaxis protein